MSFKVELREEGLVFRDPSGKALRLPELPVVHDPRRELDELLRAARFSSGGLRCLDGKTNYDRCWASDGIIESVRRGQGAGPLPRESALPVPA